jgi:hypothetical protein
VSQHYWYHKVTGHTDWDGFAQARAAAAALAASRYSNVLADNADGCGARVAEQRMQRLIAKAQATESANEAVAFAFKILKKMCAKVGALCAIHAAYSAVNERHSFMTMAVAAEKEAVVVQARMEKEAKEMAGLKAEIEEWIL